MYDIQLVVVFSISVVVIAICKQCMYVVVAVSCRFDPNIHLQDSQSHKQISEALEGANEIMLHHSIFLLNFQVDRIKLSHDHTGYGSGIFVKEVKVEVPARQDQVNFPCRCWLVQDVDDGKIEREIFAVTPLPSKLIINEKKMEVLVRE